MAPRQNRATRKLEAELRRKQQLRERLVREVKLTSKSLERGESGWIETCSKLRLEELQRQFKYDLTKGQRLLDGKNSFIQTLLQIKVETTEFYDQRVRRHQQQMDFMIGFFQLSQYRMTAWYLYDQAEYFRQGLLDQYAINLNFQRTDEYFLNYLHKSNEVALTTLREMKQKFFDKKTNVIDNLEFTRFRMFVRWVDSLAEKKHDKYWINEMLESKEKKWKLYVERSVQVEQDYVHVSKEEIAIEELQDKKSKLEIELLTLELENARQVTDLHNERNQLIRCYWEMKKPPINDAVEEIARSIAGWGLRLKKKLYKQIRQGKKLLTMAGISRKRETQMETIFSTYNEPSPKTDDWKKKMCEFEVENFTQIDKSMKKFRHRIDRIVTQNLELAEQKRHLTSENKRLQELLRQYCYHQKLSRNMQALALHQRFIVKIPVQEASEMPQLKQRALKNVQNKLSL